MQFRYLIAQTSDPYRNLAVEQSLMELAEPGMIILFLWQNDNTIVVGRNQDVDSECRKELFIREGGRIARRRSGGGAVYHDMGNLNYSFICDIEDKDRCDYPVIVKSVLYEMGFEAEYNGRNDLTIDGKKVSGNAVYQDGRAVCQHGTLLISVDESKMSRYLTPAADKLKRNGVQSVGSRTVNLRSLSAAADIDSATEAFIRVTGASVSDLEPDGRIVNDLTEFYSSSKWIYGGMI